MAEIKNAFPLPGKYHFRFKSALVPGGDREKNSVAVWMDCVDDRLPIPIWRNSIVAKVTRLSADDDDDDDDDDEDDQHFAHMTPASAAAAPMARSTQQAHPPPTRHHAPDFDIFGGGAATNATSSTHSAPPSMPNSASNSMHNFLDASSHQSIHQSPASLLDMPAPTSNNPGSSSLAGTAAANDFLGMMSHAPNTPAPNTFGQQPQQTPTATSAYPGYPTPGVPHASAVRPNNSSSSNNNNNIFDNFTAAANPGPFGGLEWK